MEDIEDLLVGAGVPTGFRLPVPAAVGVNPKQRKKNGVTKLTVVQDSPAPKIPGTQTSYIKTFGCSHNQSDSEYMAGQLSAFGYALSDKPDEADL